MDDFLRKNYFELFSLPLQFDVNLTTLRDVYRQLQKAVHPDRFAAESVQAQRLAVQYTAQANQAFQVLKDPIARGFYLLELLGHACQSDSATIQDGMFLMRQMELRERLETASDVELEELLTEVESDSAVLEKQLTSLFSALPQSGEFAQTEGLLKKMQFYRRLLQEIEERM